MAILYRFAPKKRHLRSVNLLQYEQQITGIVDEMFGDNLKDVYVYETYFDFTLERSVLFSSLREMSRQLQRSLQVPYQFHRLAVEMYAFVTWEEDSFSVLFLDRTVCEMSPQALAERVRASRSYREDAGEWANLVNYLTLYTAQLSRKSFATFFRRRCPLNGYFEGGGLFLVRLQHRRMEARPQEEIYFSSGPFPTPSFVFDHLYTVDRDCGEYADFARLASCKPVRNNRIAARIHELLSLEGAHIPTVPPALLSSWLPSGERRYVFRVHNVGQGLGASLECDGARILYFDFGMACGRNIKTLPSPANEHSLVVYSYGEGNSYRHPSETRAYELAGWNDRVDTPAEEYFEGITLSLR